MNKVLLILLMLVMPWQAFASVERQLAHVLHGDPQQPPLMMEHFAEHEHHIPHHHCDEDDDDIHVDNSTESIQHLADYEQGVCANALLPEPIQIVSCAISRPTPQLVPRLFTSLAISPPTRPPCQSA